MEPSSTTIDPTADVTFTDDDGRTFTGAEALAEFDNHIAEIEAHNRTVLRRLTPHGKRAFATYMRTGTLPTPIPARMAPRPRGAGRPAVRRSAQRSSAKSGDSPSDSESEPPPRGRRLDSRKEIVEWSRERKAELGALILAEGLGQRQLRFDERRAA